MHKEIKATLLVVFICFLWHVLTAFLLNGTGWTVFHMPAWFVVSVLGTVVLAVIGVFWLLKFVFVDFQYEEDKRVRVKMNSNQILILSVFLGYLLFNIVVSFVYSRRAEKSLHTTSEKKYFIGGRNMNGIVPAGDDHGNIYLR